MPSESLHDLLAVVNSERSLLGFIVALVKDGRDAMTAEKQNPTSLYGGDAGGWQNTSIRGISWSCDSMGRIHEFRTYAGLHPDNPWRRFAAFLYWQNLRVTPCRQ